jgi:geranylgeranyl pyrophosphate synthase
VSPRKTLETLQNKTGKLFECACRLGAIAVGAPKILEDRLGQQGAQFGLEFQLADDLADGEISAV